MKQKFSSIILCLLILVCFAGCSQKTQTRVALFESVDYTLPCFDLEASNSYMDVEDATMTLYFATDDQNGYSTHTKSTHIVLYVSNLDQRLAYDRDDRTVVDYKTLEGYTALVDYDSSNIDGSQYAIRRPMSKLKYKYSEQIRIPSQYLLGKQGTLNFYLCIVVELAPGKYNIITPKSIMNIRYVVTDGQVKFDFSDYESVVRRG